MPKTFVRSARRPVNIKLDSRTSFWTSLATFSTVPGLDRPRASLRAENELYASLRAPATALSERKERASDILAGRTRRVFFSKRNFEGRLYSRQEGMRQNGKGGG